MSGAASHDLWLYRALVRFKNTRLERRENLSHGGESLDLIVCDGKAVYSGPDAEGVVLPGENLHLHRTFAGLDESDPAALLAFAQAHGLLGGEGFKPEPIAAWSFHVTRLRFLIEVGTETKSGLIGDGDDARAAAAAIAESAWRTLRCKAPVGMFAEVGNLHARQRPAIPTLLADDREHEISDRKNFDPEIDPEEEDEEEGRPVYGVRGRSPAVLRKTYTYWPECDELGVRLFEGEEAANASDPDRAEDYLAIVEDYLGEAASRIFDHCARIRIGALSGRAELVPTNLLGILYALLLRDLAGAGSRLPSICKGCGKAFTADRPNQFYCKDDTGSTEPCRGLAFRRHKAGRTAPRQG